MSRSRWSTRTQIDTRARRVELAFSDAIDYDYLIYAVGSTGLLPEVAAGAEFALPICEFEHADRLRNRLADLHPDAPACVVGGGLPGIETAAELAQQPGR
jgi:NADH dehydrogenase